MWTLFHRERKEEEVEELVVEVLLNSLFLEEEVVPLVEVIEFACVLRRREIGEVSLTLVLVVLVVLVAVLVVLLDAAASVCKN
jgi:hypothetical protein